MTDIDILIRAQTRGENKILELEKTFRRLHSQLLDAASASLNATDEFRRMGLTARSLDEEVLQYSASLQHLDSTMRNGEDQARETERALRLIEDTLRDAGWTTQLSEQEWDDLRRTLRNVEQAQDQLRQSTDDLEEETEELTTDTDRLGRMVNEVKGIWDRYRGAVRDNVAANKALGTSFRVDLSQLAIGAMRQMGEEIFNILSQIPRDAARYLREASDEYVEFQYRVAEVNTLLVDESSAVRDRLGYDALYLGRELGRLTEETLPALYQAISAGLKPENTMPALREADKLARTTRAPLETTLLTIQRINAAYDGMYNTAQISDILFHIIEDGIVRMEEINSEFAQITAVSAELKLPLEDIAAAIITMTRQGDPLSEVSDLLSNMLTQLQIVGTPLGRAFYDASGGTHFRQFIEDGGHLIDAMILIDEYAKESNTSIAELVGGASKFYRDQRAMIGTLELTGQHLDNFAENSREAAGSTGELDKAFGEVVGTTKLLEEQAAAHGEVAKISLGAAADSFNRYFQVTKIGFFSWVTDIFNTKYLEDRILELASTASLMEPIMRQLNLANYAVDTGEMPGVYNTLLPFFKDILELSGLPLDRLDNVNTAIESLAQILSFQPVSLDREHMATALAQWEEYKRRMREAGEAATENADAHDKLIAHMNWINDNFMRAPIEEGVDDHLDRWLSQILLGLRVIPGYYEDAAGAGDEWVESLLAQNRAIRLAAEAEAAFRKELNQGAYEIVSAEENTWNLNDALLEAMRQFAIGPDIMFAATLALTDYAEEALAAAFAQQRMIMALDDIAAAVEDGNLTWEGAVEVAGRLWDQLQLDWAIEFEMSDLIAAQERLETVRGILDGLANSTTKHTVDITYTWNTPPPGAPGQTAPDPSDKHYGGWIDERIIRALPGERVLSHREINNMGGPERVDQIAAGHISGPVNIYVQDKAQAHTVNQLLDRQRRR